MIASNGVDDKSWRGFFVPNDSPLRSAPRPDRQVPRAANDGAEALTAARLPGALLDTNARTPATDGGRSW